MSLSLSSRVLAVAPSPTLSIDAKAKEMKQQGYDIIGFGAGEPDCDTPQYIRDAAKYAIDHGMTRYTPAAGTMDLRKAICDKLLRDNNLTYTPQQVIVSNGAKHSLFNTFQTLLKEGDEVLVPAPFWVSYTELIRMAGGVPVIVHAPESQGFVATAADLEPYITSRTKALVLNSPNNPNGSVWNEQQLRDIAALAVERQFYVVADEIYESLIYDDEKHVSIASLGEDIYRQTIVINGVSKSYAMTGWRIGYAAGPKEIINAMACYQSHATSNPNTIAQYAATVALSNVEESKRVVASMVAEFDARRVYIVDAINAVDGLSCTLPKGAFYVMMCIDGVMGKYFNGEQITCSSDFARMLLEDELVAVVPGMAFDADNYCRLSYATSMDNIEKGIKRIAAFVAKLTDGVE